MSLKIKPIQPIPTDTYQLARSILPDTNPYIVIGNRLSEFVSDNDFADLFSAEGKPALSPGFLAMVTVFQFMENLSDRQAATMVVVRIDWKYALHLALGDAGFNFSVLSEFRDRLVQHQAEGRVFEKLLEHLKAEGLVAGGGVQRTDALAVIGAVRRLNRLELVIETVRVALNAIEAIEAEWLQHQIPPTWVERYGVPAQAERLVRSQGEKGQAEARALAHQVGQDGLWLLEKIDAAETPEWVKGLAEVQVLRQVWEQQFEVVERQAVWKEKRETSGREVISTPHDPEVRYSEKRGEGWEGYKVHLTETIDAQRPRIITDVQTSLAPEPDHEQVKPIQAALAEREVSPDQHLGDMGYVTGETITDSAGRGIDLVGPVRPDTSPQAKMEGGITLDLFEIDYEQRLARCVRESESVVWSESRNEYGKTVFHVRFEAQTCAACPLYDRCVTGRKDKPKGRALKISPTHRAVLQRRREQETEEFKALYRRRAGIEASLSEMVRAHGLRLARYIGRAKVHLQHLFTATATNLKRTARWLTGARPVTQRKRGLQSLVPVGT
jgi:transposase